ncbi:MAG: hypothetical protein KJ893_03675 [Candidatus Omnitrophica bacterium]|nr:hypothetical protein [Candidatus Omnitrophota bacterium]MBU4477592.1 hypothetical protein [Candidatus Omnitrophota bacterium]MCG2703619.1 hypothetical protein [Candidatus Omnitrophota bacterium]
MDKVARLQQRERDDLFNETASRKDLSDETSVAEIKRRLKDLQVKCEEYIDW